ncbi:hypothetical protein CAPTEDRAFT_96991 [Capitella teleta]|uniref:Nucleoside diphosphate kinase-like domain-containing protein n=1 Tax=Capitella teleta TaxID=283909 RepID=R7T472_CAPTE|nr:hypothetical protein CAPTEDRAFT_96991 [Capitella teleta]|eukprot:ELT87722.1 hypothetical protein CAPTEDRAFT_96991 [Capitella teleta]
MARKKQEVALQIDIESQEDMDEMLNKDGLIVMDVYQEWSGPCKAMVSIFRKIKNEIGDELLRFAMAKCDTVDSLERYRGRCEPCFLFFAGGVLVNVIRGSNSPLINKVIMEQLAYEHKVLDGSAERKEIRDPLLADFDDRGAFDEEDEDEDGEEGSKRGVTLAIIKPNVVAEGKAEEVMEKATGIEILEHTERQLTEEEARSFYSDKEGEEFYEDLVKFMSSGPSHVLVLSKGETGEGIVEEWRELLGPPSVEEAKEKAPDSLRAKYGKESYANALHGSDSQARAMAELAFFFPNYTVPTVPRGKKPHVQRTLALIRPDALREKKEEIMAKVKEAGFQIAMQKEMQLTKEQAEAFYSEHKGESYFDTLTTRMSSGPVLALALARDDAITGWRDLLGPKDVKEAQESAPDSLRAQFSHTDDPVNALHGSDSPSTAENELNFFFPMQQTVAVIKPEAYESKDAIIDRIKEAGFHVAARKETELTADIAEQFYKGVEGKEFYGDLVKHMTSGQTLFMVLSREDAVDGWRSLIGPTDPEKAKEEAPESLRAQFGKDTLANAVHGSSSAEQAAENIKILFGDIQFQPDGSVKGVIRFYAAASLYGIEFALITYSQSLCQLSP